MRKIQSVELVERKNKKIKIFMGIFLITLMVSSTIGFALVFYTPGGNNDNSNDDSNGFNYNGIDFLQRSQGNWIFNFQGNVFSTIYEPRQTENVEIGIESFINSFSGKNLYYEVDDESQNNIIELTQNLQSYALKIQEACLDPENCRNDNLPIKDCTDNIIILHTSKETKTYKEDNCIFIESPMSEQVKLIDKLVFRIIGIQ